MEGKIGVSYYIISTKFTYVRSIQRFFCYFIRTDICIICSILTEPSYVLPFFSNIFMEKMVGFIKLYFPVFLLGAIFGKVVEMSGIADSIAKTIIELVGEKRTILAIVLMGLF